MEYIPSWRQRTEPHELRNRLLIKGSVCGESACEEEEYGGCGERGMFMTRGQKVMLSKHKQ